MPTDRPEPPTTPTGQASMPSSFALALSLAQSPRAVERVRTAQQNKGQVSALPASLSAERMFFELIDMAHRVEGSAGTLAQNLTALNDESGPEEHHAVASYARTLASQAAHIAEFGIILNRCNLAPEKQQAVEGLIRSSQAIARHAQGAALQAEPPGNPEFAGLRTDDGDDQVSLLVPEHFCPPALIAAEKRKRRG